jgi:hypothetical protein
MSQRTNGRAIYRHSKSNGGVDVRYRHVRLTETILLMGYYVCPRCGSNESYLGNALVNKNGASLTREIGDSGVYATGSISETETVQVRKCKKCSELLGPSNYVKSQAEITQDSEKHSRKIKVAAALILATLVLALWIRSWMLNSVH